uniref:FLYWCH-type domain-containing protein n=1 Tax=Parastrongyloides trichosuri TaxID=131310 RepID=A0A0N4ZR96_PARTI
MYQFERYDPKVPRMVTSFKGNQKLIFEGYRYNIHHLVPSKNAKTWRCVCAKKLTSDRSWCKGRAESYDNDTRGIGKGDHNHEPEHGAAELEYFKSQLIMAAIACPDTPLNDLIAEAKQYMNEGLDFPSKDSLKKSLTMARKSSENGGFKFRNYKTSGGTGVKSSRKKELTNESSSNFPAILDSIMSNTPKREADSTMNALLSLTGKVEEQKGMENNNTIPSLFPEKPITESNSNPLFAQLATFQSIQNNNASLLENINLLKQLQMTALAAAVTATPVKSAPPVKKPRKVTGTGNNSLKAIKTTTIKSGRSSISTNPSMASSLLSSPSSSINVEQQQHRQSPIVPASSTIESNSMQQKKDSIDMAIRANRLTDIFNRISERALAKATSPTNTHSPDTSTSCEDDKLETELTRTIGTQTETSDSTFDEECLIENNKCIAKEDCDCRTIKVCCCSTKGCVRKRKSEEISC